LTEARRMNPDETSRLTVFIMRVLMFAALAFALFGIAWLTVKDNDLPAHMERSGQASVISGDTVAIPDTPPIRLRGIVAPRDDKYLREPGGPESIANLRAFIEGKTISCKIGQSDAAMTYGLCYLGDKDIGLYQIETGHARDCFDRTMDDTYARAEAQARAQGKDLSAIFPLPGGCKR
jgi:micrococcal nuclease